MLVVSALAIGSTARMATLDAGYSAVAADILVWDTSGAAASAEVMVMATGRWF